MISLEASPTLELPEGITQCKGEAERLPNWDKGDAESLSKRPTALLCIVTRCVAAEDRARTVPGSIHSLDRDSFADPDTHTAASHSVEKHSPWRNWVSGLGLLLCRNRSTVTQRRKRRRRRRKRKRKERAASAGGEEKETCAELVSASRPPLHPTPPHLPDQVSFGWYCGLLAFCACYQCTADTFPLQIHPHHQLCNMEIDPINISPLLGRKPWRNTELDRTFSSWCWCPFFRLRHVFFL